MQIEGIRTISIIDFIKQINLEQIDQRTLEKHSKTIGKYVYEFKIVRNQLKWKLRKTLKEFSNLDVELKKLNIEIHVKLYESNLNSYLKYLTDYLVWLQEVE